MIGGGAELSPKRYVWLVLVFHLKLLVVFVSWGVDRVLVSALMTPTNWTGSP